MKLPQTPRRRSTIPQELDEFEDICVNQASFEEEGESTFHETEEEEEEERPANTSSIQQPPHTATSTQCSSTGPLLNQIHTFPKEIRNLLAGGMAGMMAKTAVAPFDRIKILYQVSSIPFHLMQVPKVMRRIVQTEGLDALWKGNTATMIRVFPYSGIQFMVYDRIKSKFLKRHESGNYITFDNRNNNLNPNFTKHGLTPVESLLAGMTAGIISVICTYPLDLTRAQLAVLKKHKRSPADPIPTKSFTKVLIENYQRRGWTGLFRGITPTILGILPYSGFAFTLNEQGKREIQHVTGRDLTTLERMVCGAFAGLVAQTVTYPIEVTRRRMQTLGLVGNDTSLSSLREPAATTTSAAAATTTMSSSVVNSKPIISTQQPPTLVSTVRTLYAEQGIHGFMKGVSMNWFKGPIAFSISFTSYDTLQNMFMSERERLNRPSLRRRLTGKA